MAARIAQCLTVLILIAGLAMPGHVAARQQKVTWYPYIAINTGTLGGPNSGVFTGFQLVTDDGSVLTGPDTAVIDSDFPNMNPISSPNWPGDPSIQHGAVWRHGSISDLGALPGNNNSGVFAIYASGVGVGESELSTLDPLEGFPEIRAAVFKRGQVLNLGTLGGNESFAAAINTRGQVVGTSGTGVPDPNTLAGFSGPWGTQMHAFIMQDGLMRDLGTLGGNDSGGEQVNQRGQVEGVSFTNTTVNAVTGLPTGHPFLWQNGRMQDLGTLGGAFAYTTWMNDAGEIVGGSDLAGDTTSRPFLWNGHTLLNLGTFGGDYGSAAQVNQAGDVAGFATTSANAYAHAFLWKNGVLTDLDGASSTLCDFANSLNSRDMVVGGSCGTNADGWLWKDGVRYDVNSLIAPSGVQLGQAFFINDRGEIAVFGLLPSGNAATILLVPSALAELEGISSNLPMAQQARTAGVARAMPATPMACLTVPLWRARQTQGCAGFHGGV